MSHFLTGPVEDAEDVVCGRVRVVVGLVLLEAEDHEAQHEQVDRGRVARQAEQEKDEGTTDVTRTELEYESKRTRLGIRPQYAYKIERQNRTRSTKFPIQPLIASRV